MNNNLVTFYKSYIKNYTKINIILSLNLIKKFMKILIMI